MRSPAGPSARTTVGIPRRGMPLITPAAPGTPVLVKPMPLKLAALPPIIRVHFSYGVMAATTSAILSSRSCGALSANADVTWHARIAETNIVFILYDSIGLLACSKSNVTVHRAVVGSKFDVRRLAACHCMCFSRLELHAVVQHEDVVDALHRFV